MDFFIFCIIFHDTLKLVIWFRRVVLHAERLQVAPVNVEVIGIRTYGYY